MEGIVKFILASAVVIIVLWAVRSGSFKNLLVSGILSSGLFLLLGAVKILPVFKISINLFTLISVFFLGIPGMTALLFFNILSIL